MALKYYVWTVLLFCNFLTVQSMSPPWVPCPRDRDVEAALLQRDEGYEEDNEDRGCYEQLSERTLHRVRSCTPADAACCVLTSFVVVAGSMAIWVAFNGMHHHQAHKYG